MDKEALIALLERRLAIIADHGLRNENPAEQLRRLQEVSEAIGEAHEQLRPQLPPKLQHYLTQCSFDKALSFLRQDLGSSGH